MATVTFENVNKTYGDFQAVKDLNLEIGDGEFMVLVGPSGCGKTTSLRMIAGLEEISTGTLRIGDRVVNDVPPKDRDIAMVFQSYALYPHMSVRDNLAFGLKLRKVPKAEIDRRVNEAAETIQLQKLLDRKPKELSGGQRQRVALGRAIVREPAVFLMDEPLSNLDAKLRVQTRAEIARLHQRLKTTVVYVTHDQVEAMTMGTADRGHERGPPPAGRHAADPVRHPDQPVRGRLHRQPVDELRRGPPVEGTGEGARLVGPADWSIPLPMRYREAAAPAAGKTLVAGFRPEHIDIGEAGAGAGTFQARADVVEYLGNEELLHIAAAGQDVVAIVGFRASRPAGRHRQPRPAAREAPPVRRRDGPDARAGHRGRRLTRRPRSRSEPSAPGDPAGADLVERVVDSRVVHRGRYMTFRVDTIERADGSRGTRDIVGHPGAVAILALDADERVLLVRQYRVAVGEALLEIPAGTLDVAADGTVEEPDARRPGASSRRRPACAPGRGGKLGHVLHRARVRLGADAPVSRHGPRAADGERLQPDEDEHCSSSGCPGARPSRPPSAASSATRRRSSRCSGWNGCSPARGCGRVAGAPCAATFFGSPSRASASRYSVGVGLRATARRRWVRASVRRPSRLRLWPSP